MKMAKTFNKDISTTVCDAFSRKKKKKRKENIQSRVMPITKESDSLTQSLTQHTGG